MAGRGRFPELAPRKTIYGYSPQYQGRRTLSEANAESSLRPRQRKPVQTAREGDMRKDAEGNTWKYDALAGRGVKMGKDGEPPDTIKMFATGQSTGQEPATVNMPYRPTSRTTEPATTPMATGQTTASPIDGPPRPRKPSMINGMPSKDYFAQQATTTGQANQFAKPAANPLAPITAKPGTMPAAKPYAPPTMAATVMPSPLAPRSPVAAGTTSNGRQMVRDTTKPLGSQLSLAGTNSVLAPSKDSLAPKPPVSSPLDAMVAGLGTPKTGADTDPLRATRIKSSVMAPGKQPGIDAMPKVATGTPIGNGSMPSPIDAEAEKLRKAKATIAAVTQR